MTNPRIGLLYRQTDAAMPLLDLAHAAEERRFDCIVIGEHTHIPVSRETPFPGTADGSLPDAYPEFPDPYVALAFIAARTSLRIAVGIALVAQHDPISLAKTVATLDSMSGGRLTLGVGFGWNREELANHGKNFLDRRAVVREHVELMRALWTQTEAEYHGEHANLERSWAWPKPAQPSDRRRAARPRSDRVADGEPRTRQRPATRPARPVPGPGGGPGRARHPDRGARGNPASARPLLESNCQ